MLCMFWNPCLRLSELGGWIFGSHRKIRLCLIYQTQHHLFLSVRDNILKPHVKIESQKPIRNIRKRKKYFSRCFHGVKILKYYVQ